MFEDGVFCIAAVMGILGIIWCTAGEKKYWTKYLTSFALKLLERGSLGVFLLYGSNMLLTVLDMPVKVGINVVSVGCCAVLGIPGFALNYGIACLG